MSQAYDRIAAAIKAGGDAVGGLNKLVLGTPGSLMNYPDPTDGVYGRFTRSRATGQLWDSIVIPTLLLHLSAEIDSNYSVWARILTNATGVTPTVTAQNGVASCSKDEIDGDITITLSTAYSDAYWTPTIITKNQASVLLLSNVAAGTCTFEFFDVDGAGLGVNNLELRFLGVGEM